jgi:rhodanese-related sulfurtransferase
MIDRCARILVLGLVLALSGLYADATMADQVPRMTKEELKALLGDPNLVVLDVRTQGDWTPTEEKITGAIRENPDGFESWAATYSKEKTLVLYCA